MYFIAKSGATAENSSGKFAPKLHGRKVARKYVANYFNFLKIRMNNTTANSTTAWTETKIMNDITIYNYTTTIHSKRQNIFD